MRKCLQECWHFHQVAEDYCYRFAGGLDVLGYRRLAVLLSLAGWCYGWHLAVPGRAFRWLAYRGMDRSTWSDLAVMAHYGRLDRGRGKALLGG